MKDKSLKTKEKSEKKFSEFSKRLKAFAARLEETTDCFEKKCGLSGGQVSRCEKNIRTDILARIMRVYPDEDYYYLVTGIQRKSDEMQNPVCKSEESPCEPSKSLQEEIDFLKGLVKSQQDTIYQLSIGRK